MSVPENGYNKGLSYIGAKSSSTSVLDTLLGLLFRQYIIERNHPAHSNARDYLPRLLFRININSAKSSSTSVLDTLHHTEAKSLSALRRVPRRVQNHSDDPRDELRTPTKNGVFFIPYGIIDLLRIKKNGLII